MYKLGIGLTLYLDILTIKLKEKWHNEGEKAAHFGITAPGRKEMATEKVYKKGIKSFYKVLVGE